LGFKEAFNDCWSPSGTGAQLDHGKTTIIEVRSPLTRKQTSTREARRGYAYTESPTQTDVFTTRLRQTDNAAGRSITATRSWSTREKAASTVPTATASINTPKVATKP